MNHAEKVRDAEREFARDAEAIFESEDGAVYEPGTETAEVRGDLFEAMQESHQALLALRAATCGTCGGTGRVWNDYVTDMGVRSARSARCPAGCKEGAKS